MYQDVVINRFETRNDLPAAGRVAVVELLNARLADAADLYTQTKQAHWNVKGSDFIQLHLLFDDLASHVLGHIDLLAERATSLGGEALDTVRMVAWASSLPDFPATPTTEWTPSMLSPTATRSSGRRSDRPRGEPTSSMTSTPTTCSSR